MINILVEPKVVLSMPRAWARLDKHCRSGDVDVAGQALQMATACIGAAGQTLQIKGRDGGWTNTADGHSVRGAAGQTLQITGRDRGWASTADGRSPAVAAAGQKLQITGCGCGWTNTADTADHGWPPRASGRGWTSTADHGS